MGIPDCYDPVFQEERRAFDSDRYFSRMPVCSCCEEVITPLHAYHKYLGVTVCVRCMEILNENLEISE